MKAVIRLLRFRELRPVYALLGLCLSAGFVRAGNPIVFVRQASAVSSNTVQVPGKQADKRVATALDAFDAPSPLDGVLAGPTPERSRQGRDAQRSRRAELARKERADWMFSDEKDIEEDDALSDRHVLESEADDADKKDPRRPALRQSASEKRADERDTRMPAHLLSPQVRQRMQNEALARRVQASQTSGDISESTSGNGVDLAKMLAPSEETKVTAAMARGLRELGVSEASNARRGAEPNELGSTGGSELTLGPNITGPRLGPDLGEGRFGSSLLDRSSDPERANPPTKAFGPAAGDPRSISGFPTFRDEFRSTFPSSVPANSIGPSPRDIQSMEDLNRPRRGGTLGR